MGALAVLLGAFGAHGLKAVVDDPALLSAWKTGAQYHLVHSLALLATAAHPRQPRAAGWLFAVGVVLFSGSLYAIALGVQGVGVITPLGGLALTAGWVSLAWASRPG
ncbi:MAG: DUF423 domain-containing protein [Proteobacteria bacterium]|nr:DUF423 domain-containing protein [Pseudomonadota bacterium]